MLTDRDLQALLGTYPGHVRALADLLRRGAITPPAVAGLVNGRPFGVISVTEFGAVGNGTADDTDAIQAAFDEAASRAPAVVVFPLGTYRVTRTVTALPGVSILMHGQLMYGGSADEPALVIGADTTGFSEGFFDLAVDRATTSDWTSESCIGILFKNVYRSHIRIRKVKGFTIGAQFLGKGRGVAYNHVFLGLILNNRIGLDLRTEQSGWVNENLFYGGSFDVNPGTHDGESRYGVRFSSADGSYTNHNNNRFFGPCFELKDYKATPGEALPIWLQYGTENAFYEVRSENNGPYVARFENTATLNIITLGIAYDAAGGIDAIDDQSARGGNLIFKHRGILTTLASPIWLSGPLHRQACYYDSTKVNIAGVFVNYSGDAVPLKAADNIILGDDYIELTNWMAVGVFVNTRETRHLLIKRDVDPARPGRVAIRCYDADGNILGSGGPHHPYVRGTPKSIFWYGTFGGTYMVGEDTADDVLFTLHPDVARVAVLCSAGTNPCRIRGFGLYTYGRRYAVVSTQVQDGLPPINRATAPPTVGTWPRGFVLLNDSPSASGRIGWVCVAGGTPGTWKPFGAIDA